MANEKLLGLMGRQEHVSFRLDADGMSNADALIPAFDQALVETRRKFVEWVNGPALGRTTAITLTLAAEQVHVVSRPGGEADGELDRETK